MLLGASSADQLMENIGAIQVSRGLGAELTSPSVICAARICGAPAMCQALFRESGLRQGAAREPCSWRARFLARTDSKH